MHLGIDPGSKTTGLALMRESDDSQRHVLCLFDLIYRGFQIKKALEQRRGFRRGYLMRQKQVHSFQTGDMVKASVPTGKKAGTHTARVAVRKTGSFNIQTEHGAVQGISLKYCTLIQRGDGYGYHLAPTTHQPTKGGTG